MSVKYLVFISYRRTDSIHITDRIYDHLKSHFGKTKIFKDVDNIPLGLDFGQVIDEAVGSCRVLIAIIGKDWLDIKNEQGRRLHNPTDFVRIEIESALRQGIPLIPVLVDDAQMPLERDLPTTLQGLTDHNGIKIRPDPDFQNDMKRLTNGIKSLSGRFYLVERVAWWFSLTLFLLYSGFIFLGLIVLRDFWFTPSWEPSWLHTETPADQVGMSEGAYYLWSNVLYWSFDLFFGLGLVTGICVKILLPLLVRLDDQSQIAFGVERTENQQVVVFLLGSPDTTSGTVVLIESDRVSFNLRMNIYELGMVRLPSNGGNYG